MTRQYLLSVDRPARERHYSKAHAHTSAAVLICVKAKGYTYTWPEQLGLNTVEGRQGRSGQARRLRAGRHGVGGARGARWYHQHFGASKDPFRLTAWFGPHNPGREPGPPGEKHTDYTAMDIPEGGTAIPYYMEDPFLRQEYAERMKTRRRREPHAAGILRARLPRAIAERMTA